MILQSDGFLSSVINSIAKGEDLDFDGAREVMARFVNGDFTQAQLGSLMMGLRMKGETSDELAGFLSIYREKLTPVDVSPGVQAVDLCGTGGDERSAGFFNISTTVAFVVAGMGVPVLKHGNVAFSSQSGSTDVLRSLSVPTDLGPTAVAECLAVTGIAYMHGPLFNTAMRNVLAARQELRMRTFFNLLGPMSNPAGVKRQVIGVPHPRYTDVVASAMRDLGSVHVMVVSSEDGLDELSTSAPTTVAELSDGQIVKYSIDARDFSIPIPANGSMEGGQPAENAKILIDILENRGAPAMTDVVLLNAAAVAIVAGVASDLKLGIELARESVEGGAARDALARVIDFNTA